MEVENKLGRKKAKELALTKFCPDVIFIIFFWLIYL